MEANQKGKARNGANPAGESGPRGYDLEERTFEFAPDVRTYVRRLPRTLSNQEDAKQFTNASGAVGANYVEANEALSRKDFRMRVKICRKEATESRYWLRLLYLDRKQDLEDLQPELFQEATELTNIWRAKIRKTEGAS